MDAQQQLMKLVENEQKSRDTHHHPNKNELKGQAVAATNAKKDFGQRVVFRGKNTTYYIWVAAGMAEKWRQDKSIQLTEVVESTI